MIKLFINYIDVENVLAILAVEQLDPLFTFD